MPNTKAIGVAFADPEFESVTVTGPVSATGAVTGGSIVSTAASGAVASNANATVTATTAPAGSLGITTNATGVGKLFYSDGTVWRFMAIT
jgi:hypothetical protein